mmetsp:Transcript_3659/g.8080  ORF Transcript_3659/g.8080 Transcript_3659/m.8080 type:complete len:420 (+) Transcript_3659:216-1475(+)
MPHTVVTYTSWGERLRSACCGVCFGIILFLGSFPLLVWNEGRSIQRYESLEEGRKNVVVVADPTASIDRSREGMLVYMSGKAEAGADAAAVSDTTFGVSPSNILKLKRVAEMYQWEESSSSHTTKTEGGGTRTETTYSYHKTWSDHLIKSASFSDSSHENPSSMPYTSQIFLADPIVLGSYTLSNGLVGKINWFSDWTNDGSLSVDNIDDDYAHQTAIVYDNGFYMGSSPGSPEVGDMKISFKYIPEGTVSLVAAQTGETFTSYVTKRGGSLLLLRSGYHTADDLFLLAERDNVVITWLVRFAGFIIMYMGLKMVSQPLEVVLDRIPLIGRFAGDIMGGATSLVTCIVAAALSILTIAIAWLAYRPLLTFTLFAIVAGLVYFAKNRVDVNRHGTEIPMVKATPIFTDAEPSAPPRDGFV